MISVKKVNHNNGHIINTAYSLDELEKAFKDTEFYNQHKEEGYSAEIRHCVLENTDRFKIEILNVNTVQMIDKRLQKVCTTNDLKVFINAWENSKYLWEDMKNKTWNDCLKVLFNKQDIWNSKECI